MNELDEQDSDPRTLELTQRELGRSGSYQRRRLRAGKQDCAHRLSRVTTRQGIRRKKTCAPGGDLNDLTSPDCSRLDAWNDTDSGIRKIGNATPQRDPG